MTLVCSRTSKLSSRRSHLAGNRAAGPAVPRVPGRPRRSPRGQNHLKNTEGEWWGRQREEPAVSVAVSAGAARPSLPPLRTVRGCRDSERGLPGPASPRSVSRVAQRGGVNLCTSISCRSGGGGGCRSRSLSLTPRRPGLARTGASGNGVERGVRP